MQAKAAADGVLRHSLAARRAAKSNKSGPTPCLQGQTQAFLDTYARYTQLHTRILTLSFHTPGAMPSGPDEEWPGPIRSRSAGTHSLGSTPPATAAVGASHGRARASGTNTSMNSADGSGTTSRPRMGARVPRPPGGATGRAIAWSAQASSGRAWRRPLGEVRRGIAATHAHHDHKRLVWAIRARSGMHAAIVGPRQVLWCSWARVDRSDRCVRRRLRLSVEATRRQFAPSTEKLNHNEMSLLVVGPPMAVLGCGKVGIAR